MQFLLKGQVSRGLQRNTKDIDLVIQVSPTDTQSAEDLTQILYNTEGFGCVEDYGVNTPVLNIRGSDVPIEIFDPTLWRDQAPQFSQVDTRIGCALPSGLITFIFPQPWLLHEKIYNVHQHGNAVKRESDMHIAFLSQHIQPEEAGQGVLDFTTENQATSLPRRKKKRCAWKASRAL